MLVKGEQVDSLLGKRAKLLCPLCFLLCLLLVPLFFGEGLELETSRFRERGGMGKGGNSVI